jgi:hypothetical protein
MHIVKRVAASVAFATAVSGAIFALNVQSAYASSLILNGSFEADIQAANSWAIYANLTGWTGGPGWTGNAGDPGGIELRNNVAGTASDGVNFIELDVYHNSLASQTIVTTLTQTYNLSFAYAPRVGVPASSNGIEVFWGGTSLGIFTGDGTVSTAWTVFNFSVIGTGSDVVRFVAVGTDDSLGGSLDAVALTATPLPAALPLLATGLGAFGLLGWRRKRKAQAAA